MSEILTLIQSAFATIDGRIDPPSSMHRLTLDTLRAQATAGEIWAIGAPLVACVVLTPKPDGLYVGKLAVDPKHLGRGYARRLIAQAAATAERLHLPRLILQTRVELAENHAIFARLGFVEVARTAHSGYPHPTSITMHRPVPL